MSVLITGMKMPNNCGECYLYNAEYEKCNYSRDCSIDEDCPLVEMPLPNEEYEFITWLLNFYGKHYSNTKAAVIEWLKGENYERTD